jgi:hypothetical protein
VNVTRSSKLRRGLRILAAWSLLAAILACGGDDDDSSGETTSASSASGSNNRRTFMIRPGFTPDPMTATGEAGGSFDASRHGPNCRGFIGAVSDHTLHLTRDFNNLRVLVSSPADTTLVIRMADGSYRCNDDAEGLNPIIQGPFPRGMHRVYVGTIGRGQSANYTIGVSELSSVTTASLGGGGAAAQPSAQPTPTPSGGTGPVTLRTGFMPDPETRRGTAGGAMDAAQLTNNQCRGWIPNTPQHTLMAQSDFSNLRILVNSQTDTSLVIRGPDGQYRCNDDAEGLNPIVQGAFGPGAYQIFVGTYRQNQSGPYVIGFSELSSVTAASLGN